MKILLLTARPTSPSNKKIIEAIKARQHELICLNPINLSVHISNSEKGYDSIYHHTDSGLEKINIKDIDGVIPRIGANVIYASTVVRQIVENLGIYSTQTAEGILMASNKLYSLQALSSAGIATPKTIYTQKSTDTEALIKRVGGLPCIAKIVNGSKGEGVVLLETMKTAKTVLESYYKMKSKVILQEYIEAKGRDIRAIVIGGKVVSAYERRAVRGEFRANIAKGAEGCPVELTEEEKEMCIKSAKAINLEVAGIDFVRDKNNKAFVIEVNSNFGLYIESITNDEIADKLIQHVEVQAKVKPHINITKFEPTIEQQAFVEQLLTQVKGKSISYQDRKGERKNVRILSDKEIYKIMLDTFNVA